MQLNPNKINDSGRPSMPATQKTPSMQWIRELRARPEFGRRTFRSSDFGKSDVRSLDSGPRSEAPKSRVRSAKSRKSI